MSKHTDSVVNADDSEELSARVLVDNDESHTQQTSDESADTEAAPHDLSAALSTAQAKADEHWDQLVRVRADMENVRRRSEKELVNAHKYALEKFVHELLPVLDSLESGLVAVDPVEGSSNAQVNKFREGSELTLKMFQGALTKFNCIAIDPVGEKFNPELHQAMSMQEKSDIDPNTILVVVQKGYQLNERLVRPAMVVVSKAVVPPKESNIDEMA